MNNYKPELQIYRLNECGYEEALIGLSLNKDQRAKNLSELVEHIENYLIFGDYYQWTEETLIKMGKVAEKLAKCDEGHNKFLESIYCWFLVIAPRYLWAQMDTYRLSTKQSQATMHLCRHREVNKLDFEEQDVRDEILEDLNKYYKLKEIEKWKRTLPEGFLQARIWVMNYKVIRNILLQRKSHKLKGWKKFCELVYDKVDHPELLPKIGDKK